MTSGNSIFSIDDQKQLHKLTTSSATEELFFSEATNLKLGDPICEIISSQDNLVLVQTCAVNSIIKIQLVDVANAATIIKTFDNISDVSIKDSLGHAFFSFSTTDNPTRRRFFQYSDLTNIKEVGYSDGFATPADFLISADGTFLVIWSPATKANTLFLNSSGVFKSVGSVPVDQFSRPVSFSGANFYFLSGEFRPADQFITQYTTLKSIKIGLDGTLTNNPDYSITDRRFVTLRTDIVFENDENILLRSFLIDKEESYLTLLKISDPQKVRHVDLLKLDFAQWNIYSARFIDQRYLIFNTYNGIHLFDTQKPRNEAGVLNCDQGTIDQRPVPFYDYSCISALHLNLKYLNFNSYTPRYPLFSDGADKIRYVYLPHGSQIDNSNPDDWIYPEGTVLFKEFRVAGKIAEQRMLEKINNGVGTASWRASVYVDGIRRADDDTSFLIKDGYKIPPTNSCMNCHSSSKDVSLGFSNLQLGGKDEPFSISGLNQKNLLKIPVEKEDDINGSDLDKTVLGYLHSNCGTCHSEAGILKDSGFSFKHLSSATSLETEPGYATALAKSKLVIGDPTNSPIYLRMSSNDKPMPPREPLTPNQTLDLKAIETLQQWILQLK